MTNLASIRTPPSSVIPRDANAPFNDNQSADVVLRTADKVDFHLHKIILSFASPIFEKELNSQWPTVANTTSIACHAAAGRPLIEVPEDARTIDFIMRCCYPIAKPTLAGLDNIRAVLVAAQEYSMIVVTSVAKDALIKLVDTHPFDAMSISIRCRLFDVFCLAFKRVSELPSLLSLDSEELDVLSGRQYKKLLSFHSHCMTNLDPLFRRLWKIRRRDKLIQKYPSKSHAEAPFDDSSADVILRSSDQVDFYIYKNILSIASPFFKDMFSLPQSPTASALPSSSLSWEEIPQPIIDVTEDAQTLDHVLRCIYPVQMPELPRAHIYSVLEAGRKYDIDSAVRAAEATLVALVDRSAPAAFALGVQCQMEHICAMAARRLLKRRFMDISSPEFCDIPARPVRKLLQFHEQCGKAASAVARSRGWFSRNDFGGMVSNGRSWGPCCLPDGQNSGWFAHRAVWNYLKQAEQILLLRPHSETVLSPSRPIDMSCALAWCERQCYGRDLSQALRSAVEAATAEDKIPIPTFC